MKRCVVAVGVINQGTCFVGAHAANDRDQLGVGWDVGGTEELMIDHPCRALGVPTEGDTQSSFDDSDVVSPLPASEWNCQVADSVDTFDSVGNQDVVTALFRTRKVDHKDIDTGSSGFGLELNDAPQAVDGTTNSGFAFGVRFRPIEHDDQPVDLVVRQQPLKTWL